MSTTFEDLAIRTHATEYIPPPNTFKLLCSRMRSRWRVITPKKFKSIDPARAITSIRDTCYSVIKGGTYTFEIDMPVNEQSIYFINIEMECFTSDGFQIGFLRPNGITPNAWISNTGPYSFCLYNFGRVHTTYQQFDIRQLKGTKLKLQIVLDATDAPFVGEKDCPAQPALYNSRGSDKPKRGKLYATVNGEHLGLLIHEISLPLQLCATTNYDKQIIKLITETPSFDQVKEHMRLNKR